MIELVLERRAFIVELGTATDKAPLCSLSLSSVLSKTLQQLLALEGQL